MTTEKELYKPSLERIMVLQWRHMSVMVSEITSNVTVCSTTSLGWQPRNISVANANIFY